MIKAVFIDIDNTLLDFDAYVRQSMREGFEVFGLGKYDDSMYYTFERINHGLWRQIEEGTITYQELYAVRWNRVFEAIGVKGDGVAFEKYFKGCLAENAIPVKGAMELLEYLSKKYILCSASNGPYLQQLKRLTKAEMITFFSHHFISEKIGVSKPAKEFFDAALAELNQSSQKPILPEEIIMIGDSLTSDMAGANNSGIHTCFFDRRGSEIPSNISIEHRVTSLEEIKNIL